MLISLDTDTTLISQASYRKTKWCQWKSFNRDQKLYKVKVLALHTANSVDCQNHIWFSQHFWYDLQINNFLIDSESLGQS